MFLQLNPFCICFRPHHCSIPREMKWRVLLRDMCRIDKSLSRSSFSLLGCLFRTSDVFSLNKVEVYWPMVLHSSPTLTGKQSIRTKRFLWKWMRKGEWPGVVDLGWRNPCTFWPFSSFPFWLTFSSAYTEYGEIKKREEALWPTFFPFLFSLWCFLLLLVLRLAHTHRILTSRAQSFLSSFFSCPPPPFFLFMKHLHNLLRLGSCLPIIPPWSFMFLFFFSFFAKVFFSIIA